MFSLRRDPNLKESELDIIKSPFVAMAESGDEVKLDRKKNGSVKKKKKVFIVYFIFFFPHLLSFFTAFLSKTLILSDVFPRNCSRALEHKIIPHAIGVSSAAK